MFQSVLLSAALCAATPPAAGEINILWPFIGISQLKALIPLFGDEQLRGELLVGTYLDYAQIVRKDSGKTWLLAGMLGYRQFFGYGIHLEVAFNIGLRHEIDHPGDGATLNDFYIRAWPMLGYQLELSDRFYLNARGGVGIIIYRQTHFAEEKKLVPTGDVNFGFRF